MRSVAAVGIGMVLAFVFVLLIVFGILAPVLSELFRFQPSASSLGAFAPLLLLVCAFAFYFGGMATAYKAPSRRRLHGVLVAPAAFLVSTVINVLTGRGPFPGYDTAWTVVLVVLFLAVAVAGSYIGARRGQTLYFHNARITRRRNAARARREAQESEGESRESGIGSREP